MAVKLYKSVGTTGGTTGKVDGIDGNLLNQGDFDFVFEEGDQYWMPFHLNAAIGGTESDPLLIAPDANAGNKRWRLGFIRWLKNAINYAGDFIIKGVGKGLVLGDGAHDGSGFKIYKPAGNEPVRIVPISDAQGVAFRNAADDSTIALFKSGDIDISGLVAPEEDTDPATKAYADGENSFSSNGYSKLPGGLMLQWVVGGGDTAEGSQIVTLPTPFPNQCLIAFTSLWHISGGATLNREYQIVAWDENSVTVFHQRFNDASEDTAKPLVFAIGY